MLSIFFTTAVHLLYTPCNKSFIEENTKLVMSKEYIQKDKSDLRSTQPYFTKTFTITMFYVPCKIKKSPTYTLQGFRKTEN